MEHALRPLATAPVLVLLDIELQGVNGLEGMPLKAACTNDGDVEPALKWVRADFPQIRIGLVLPLPEPAPGRVRFANQRLVAQAHWVRHHIRDEELERAQMPGKVPTRKKPSLKPAHW